MYKQQKDFSIVLEARQSNQGTNDLISIEDPGSGSALGCIFFRGQVLWHHGVEE